MKASLFILLLFLFYSCSTTRHLKPSTQTKDSVKVEIRTKIEYVKDTIFIDVPNETVKQRIKDTASHLETTFAVSDAKIDTSGILLHTLSNKTGKRPTEIKKDVIYRDSIIYRDKIQNRIETVEIEKRLTMWQKIRLYGFWILLAIILLYVRLKLKK